MSAMIFPAWLCILGTSRSLTEGRLQQMMFLAILTVCCTFLFSWEEGAPNQVVKADARNAFNVVDAFLLYPIIPGLTAESSPVRVFLKLLCNSLVLRLLN